MNTRQLWMLLRLAALATLSGTLLGACGGSGSGSGYTLSGASGTGLGAAAKALADAKHEADVPPAIALHPHSLMVKEGEPAMFGVMAVVGGQTEMPWR